MKNEKKVIHHYNLMDSIRIIKEYYGHLIVHIFDTIDEMEQFFENLRQPKFTLWEIDNMNKCNFILKNQ